MQTQQDHSVLLLLTPSECYEDWSSKIYVIFFFNIACAVVFICGYFLKLFCAQAVVFPSDYFLWEIFDATLLVVSLLDARHY